MRTIIDRSLLGDVLKTFTVIVLVLLLLIMANTFVRLLGQTAAGAISHELLLALLGLNVIKLLGFVMPPAFFFSILWVMGRLYRDSEMAALSAAGISTARLYRPFVISAIPIALVVGILVLWVLPQAKSTAELMQHDFSESFDVTGIKAGTFNEFNKGRLVVYAASSSKNKDQLQNLFVQHIQKGKPGIVVAKSARIETNRSTGHRYIVMNNGHRYRSQDRDGKVEYSISSFREYGVRMPDVATSVPGRVSTGARSSKQLWNSTRTKDHAELQYRISAPLSVFILLIISVPLARSTPRQGAYGRLTIAVIIYVIYMNLQKVAEEWMAKGDTPYWMGTWWISVLFVLIAVAIHYFDSIKFRAHHKRLFRVLS